MMKKRKLLLATILTTTFIGLPSVNAYTFGVGFADTGEGGHPPEREDFKYETILKSGDTTTVYTCTYNYDINVSNNITINGYNNNDEPILETSLNISEEDKILAGTSIGLNIYETKTISWEVTKAEVIGVGYTTEKIPVYRCTYTAIDDSGPKPIILPIFYNSIMLFSRIQSIAKSCSDFNDDKATSCDAAPIGCRLTQTVIGYNDGSVKSEYIDVPEKEKQACEKKATEEAKNAAQKNVSPSYQLELSDSNDINGTETQTVAGELTGRRGDLSSGSETYTYSYKQARACINVKTSKVTYKSDSCGEEEIEIKNKTINGMEHWHYFIPLNAKSNQNAEINLLPANGGTLVTNECLYVIENNNSGETTYVDLIIKTDGTNFKGDYSRGEKASADIKEINKNGCKLTSKIKINAQQRFYNEVEDEDGNITFKGFNFYYKPIDINNPFPNAITDTSIWYDWYNSNKKNPDLTKSYENVTYIAEIKNANDIRNYTKTNPYTSWDNMYTTGVSKFIDNEGIVTRYVDRNSFYKLGCGPSNADWSECKR